MSELFDNVDYSDNHGIDSKETLERKVDWARVTVLEFFFMFPTVVVFHAAFSFILSGFGITLSTLGGIVIVIVTLLLFVYPFFVLSKKFLFSD